MPLIMFVSSSFNTYVNLPKKNVLTYITSLCRNPIHLTFYPNIDKYLWNLLVKFQLDPTVEFGVMFNSVKLDGRKFTSKSESNLAWFVSQD